VAQRCVAGFRRQQFEELAETGGIEFFGRRELPKQRPEPVAELEHAAVEKALDRVAGVRKLTPVGGKARPFDRKHETVRYRRRPFAEGRRRLRTIERGVDLDRGQMARRVFKLFRLRQALRIEHAPPRREIPAADADVDVSGLA
jgi:hypothetical protein